MRKPKLLWHLAIPFVLITTLTVAVFTWKTVDEVKTLNETQVRAELTARARLVGAEVAPLLAEGRRDAVHALCRNLAAISATRITVILPDGQVISDSMEDPSKMENHADRPEVIDALATGSGTSVRFSHTVHFNTMYVAMPLRIDGAVAGVVRTALPLTDIEETLSTIRRTILLSGALLTVLAGVVIFLFSRRVAGAVRDLRAGAESFARGDFAYRFTRIRTEEESALADAMESMARQLDERIATVVRQRNEQDAMLSSMVEGLIAIDNDERILTINLAAARLFRIGETDVRGRHLQEAVRNADLLRFARQALEADAPIEGIITIRAAEDRSLQAHGTRLSDASGGRFGAVMVLNDITRLRRLENIRRDFVANVSHELKTPVTSIKGFVETLLDGAMQEPRDAERFLKIVAREADRLIVIIEDLLSLSRIEQDEGRDAIPMERTSVRTVLQSAVDSLRHGAEDRRVAITVACPDDLSVLASASLLEQAVGNLIDNAIKYSDDGGDVTVSAAATDEEIRIDVVDRGCGIPAGHLPRIFERFYRVDASRSRALGGSGLGLAIVKHIAQVHGGRVDVVSEPGRGSTFTITIPR